MNFLLKILKSVNLSIKKPIFLGWLCLLVFISSSFDFKEDHKSMRKVEKVINEIRQDNALKNSNIGFYAVNLTKNKIIANVNSLINFTPASTLKILIVATALEMLGEDFKFETKLQYDGEIDSKGVLHGNIYILGGGDPALGSSNFDESCSNPHIIDTWVGAIKDIGIKKIEGSIIADISIYPDISEGIGSWAWGDIANYYGTFCSALSIFDNTYLIHFDSSDYHEKHPKIVEISPSLPKEININNCVTFSDTDSSYACIYGSPFGGERTIKGTISRGKKDFIIKGAIPNPPYFTVYTIQNALENSGIEVMGKPTVVNSNVCEYDSKKRTLIHTIVSPPMKDIVRILNNNSVNLYAEHLLIHIGLLSLGKATTNDGLIAMKNFWINHGIDLSNVLLKDASGLFRQNAITPQKLIEILIYMKNSKNWNGFYNSFPMAGKEGNVASCFASQKINGNLKVKSGGMSAVRGFVGYCKNSNKDDIAFDIIINNHNLKLFDIVKKIETILEAIIN